MNNNKNLQNNNALKRVNFKKVMRLDDFMFDENTIMAAHVISFGDDVYHDHDFYEISYLLNDEISHFVNERQMDLLSGDVVFFRPNDKHLFLRENSKAKHRDIIFQKDFFESVINFLDKDFASFYNAHSLPIKINVSMEKIEEIEGLIENYYSIPHENAKEKLLISKFILIELLFILKSSASSKKDQHSQYPPWLKELLQQMHMRQLYKEGLSSIVSRFDYSQSYMCNVFKKYLGTTMTEYLNDLRLQYAASQIKLTTSSILIISQDAGFSSISYFNKQFKKKYGCSPRQYRTQNRYSQNH